MAENNLTIEYQLYLKDRDFKRQSNFIKYVQEARNFYNGNQYPSDNPNNYIRVTMNIVAFCVNLKASKINGTSTYIQFTCDDDSVDCVHLEEFDEYNRKKMDETTNNFQANINGFTDGTAISYIRFDEDDTSYKGIYKGGLVEEQIDILRFAVANPYVKELQNQKWVMFWVDSEVGAVRDLVEREDEEERKKAQALVVPDNYDDVNSNPDYNRENITHKVCTVFTRYFKINGEVYYMMSTKNVNLFEYPHPLSTIIQDKYIEEMKKMVKKHSKENQEEDSSKVYDLAIDYEDMINQLPDPKPMEDEEYEEIKEKFSLYPFARYVPTEISNSFYGKSDVKELIPSQKAINYQLSMQVKCSENNAYNKIFAKPDALQGQEITTDPGQVLYDYSKGINGWGVKFAESQPMPTGMMDFTERFLSMVRIVYGFNDVMDGSSSTSDMSGYLYQQMVKNANTPLEQIQKQFWKYLKDKAAIRLTFYKFFVDTAKYSVTMEDFEWEEQENARKILLNMATAKGNLNVNSNGEMNLEQLKKPTSKTRVVTMTRDNFYGKNFDIGIDVMQGTQNSELAESQMWDTLIMNGGIQNMQPETLAMYLEASPKISKRTKAALKSCVRKLEKSENEQLRQQLNEILQKASQLADYTKQLENRSNYQGQYIDNLTKEFTNKLNTAQHYLNNVNKQYASTQGQKMSEGEAKSNASRGVSGSDIEETNGTSGAA